MTHTITAHEAHWHETKIEHNPDAINNVEKTHSETTESVDGTVFHWEYECTCGEEFRDYEAAKDHLQEKAGA